MSASPFPPGRPTLLDAAMGTALLARGLPAGALPEEWLLERPEAIAAVHAEHAAAGAGVLLTCTFNVAGPRLEARLDPGRLEARCAAAVALAREAARGAPLHSAEAARWPRSGRTGTGVRVAGAVGPTGLHGPGLPAPDPGAIRARYGRAVAALASAGVDLLWLETQWDLAEARLALAAARETGLPAVVTFTLREEGGGLAAPDGTPAEQLLEAVAEAGAAAAGVNCVPPGPALAALARWARAALPVPFVAKPSPGLPGAVLAPGAFAAALRPALAEGVAAAGACCGGTGEHLRALRALAG